MENFFATLIKDAELAEREPDKADLIEQKLCALAKRVKGKKSEADRFILLGFYVFSEVVKNSARIASALAGQLLDISDDKEDQGHKLVNRTLKAFPKKQIHLFARLAFPLCGSNSDLISRCVQYYLCKALIVIKQENGSRQTKEHLKFVFDSCGDDKSHKFMAISFGMTRISKWSEESAEAVFNLIGLMHKACGEDADLRHLFSHQGSSALDDVQDGWTALVLIGAILDPLPADNTLTEKIVRQSLCKAKTLEEQGETWAANKIIATVKEVCMLNEKLTAIFIQSAPAINHDDAENREGVAAFLNRSAAALSRTWGRIPEYFTSLG